MKPTPHQLKIAIWILLNLVVGFTDLYLNGPIFPISLIGVFLGYLFGILKIEIVDKENAK